MPNFYFSNPYSVILQRCLLPGASVFTHSKFWNLYCDLGNGTPPRVFRPTPDEVFERVHDLVAHSYQNVAFYRERFQSLGLAPDGVKTLEDFKKIPPTTKADILANFPDRMTSTVSLFQPWRYVSTSGTVQRMTAIQDFRKREYIRATQLLGLKIAANYEPGMRYMEIPPDICTDVCGASDSLEPPLLTYLWDNLKKGSVFNPETISNLRGLVERQIIYRRLQLPALCPDGLVQSSHKLSTYIEKIDAYRPHVLKALPVYLYVLGLHILKEKLRPPRITGCLMPMGSSLTPHMKHVVQFAFQCPVHEDYGCAELGSVAVECGHQRGLHPLSSLFYVEVVCQGRAARPGEIGRVLITDLWNYAMPFLRYDIGDVAMVYAGGCDCGISGDRFEVQGRIQDCLVAEDGALVTNDRIVDAVIADESVLGLQLDVRRKHEIQLQVVPKNGADVDLNGLAQLLRGLLGGGWKIHSRVVPTILPEPGGKYRFVRNHLPLDNEQL